jgi:ABC-2 type transport system permease protein
LYPGIVAYFARLEWGPLLTAYAGLILMGATFIAVGLCVSSFFENQIMAGTVTFLVLLMFWVIGWSGDAAGGVWKTILSELSIIEHYDTFAKGIFDTKDVIYYLNFTILALFVGLKSLEARRWKG